MYRIEGITIFIRVRKRNHIFGQNFWNPTDTRGHDVQARASRLQDGNAKSLR